MSSSDHGRGRGSHSGRGRGNAKDKRRQTPPNQESSQSNSKRPRPDLPSPTFIGESPGFHQMANTLQPPQDAPAGSSLDSLQSAYGSLAGPYSRLVNQTYQQFPGSGSSSCQSSLGQMAPQAQMLTPGQMLPPGQMAPPGQLAPPTGRWVWEVNPYEQQQFAENPAWFNFQLPLPKPVWKSFEPQQRASDDSQAQVPPQALTNFFIPYSGSVSHQSPQHSATGFVRQHDHQPYSGDNAQQTQPQQSMTEAIIGASDADPTLGLAAMSAPFPWPSRNAILDMLQINDARLRSQTVDRLKEEQAKSSDSGVFWRLKRGGSRPYTGDNFDVIDYRYCTHPQVRWMISLPRRYWSTKMMNFGSDVEAIVKLREQNSHLSDFPPHWYEEQSQMIMSRFNQEFNANNKIKLYTIIVLAGGYDGAAMAVSDYVFRDGSKKSQHTSTHWGDRYLGKGKGFRVLADDE